MVAIIPAAVRGERLVDFDEVGMDSMPDPDPQVPASAKRRSFTREYKLAVLREYEAASPAERGVLMRREGLYSSHISQWRAQRDAAAKNGSVKRGRPPRDPRDAKIERLERDLAKVSSRLEKAEIVIDVQKKLARRLGVDPMTGENL